MDEVEEAVEKAKKDWNETYRKTQDNVTAVQEYGNPRGEAEGEETTSTRKTSSLPRLNGLAQDGLAQLESLQLQLDLLAPQLLSHEKVASVRTLLGLWKTQSSKLRLGLRNANLQAKANMRKAALEERQLLLGGGEESTIRRRNLQTKAGMMSAAENITESLRRSRQLMVQEVERSTNTLMTFEESTGVLRKAESEYKGHRSLFMRTRNLLSTMERQDVIYRLLLLVGFLCFSCAVLFVGSKRIGLLKLQRKVTAALKAGMAAQGEIQRGAAEEGVPVVKIVDNAVPEVDAPVEQLMHDEL